MHAYRLVWVSTARLLAIAASSRCQPARLRSADALGLDAAERAITRPEIGRMGVLIGRASCPCRCDRPARCKRLYDAMPGLGTRGRGAERLGARSNPVDVLMRQRGAVEGGRRRSRCRVPFVTRCVYVTGTDTGIARPRRGAAAEGDRAARGDALRDEAVPAVRRKARRLEHDDARWRCWRKARARRTTIGQFLFAFAAGDRAGNCGRRRGRGGDAGADRRSVPALYATRATCGRRSRRWSPTSRPRPERSVARSRPRWCGGWTRRAASHMTACPSRPRRAGRTAGGSRPATRVEHGMRRWRPRERLPDTCLGVCRYGLAVVSRRSARTAPVGARGRPPARGGGPSNTPVFALEA